LNDIRKELSDYSDKRISYASKPQALATEALMEIHHLDERIAELEAREKELVAVYAGARFSLNAAHNKHDLYKKAVQDVMGSKFHQVQNRLKRLGQ
jgi:DNA repair exonuclease SbcCD ATPase subunit